MLISDMGELNLACRKAEVAWEIRKEWDVDGYDGWLESREDTASVFHVHKAHIDDMFEALTKAAKDLK